MTQIRHTCSYYDQLTKYGWQQHDGLSFGLQEINDPQNGAELTVQWVKPELDSDPNHWILRVTTEALVDGRNDMCSSQS